MSSTKAWGWSPEHNAWLMPMPANMHAHFRHPSDARFPIAVKASAELYQHATAMPNLGKQFLIRDAQGALAYRDAIQYEGQKYNGRFAVNVPLYLEPDTMPETVREGYERGAWIAAKLYPEGGTTQSDEGVDFRFLGDLDPVFATMEELGMILLVHAEPVYDLFGDEIDIFKREEASLPYIYTLIQQFPRLKIVFEHISSEAGAHFVAGLRESGFENIDATIAPQYLEWNRNQLFRGGMSPVFYSIPILKEEADRRALVDFMLDGHGFLGTDSAPHLIAAKSKPCGCAGGVFNEPVGLYVYFDLFKFEGEKRRMNDWFERFVQFACHKGPAFYGLKHEDIPVLMTTDPWQVPSSYGRGKNLIVPMKAGETIEYQLKASHL